VNETTFEELCTHHFDITIGKRDKEFPCLSPIDLEHIVGQKYGALFLSFCHAQLPPESHLAIELEYMLDSLDYEVERQQSLIYGLSESTGPHPSQYEESPETPPWIWEVVYGYKRKSINPLD
jgi:hypothetical protein